MSGALVSFRRLQRQDFPLLISWLVEPLVARWWNHDTSPAAVERDFGASVDGRDSTSMFIASVADRPFGLIQRYAIDAYPEYVEELSSVCTLPPHALSIDYLIGPADMRGKGFGTTMIAAFLVSSWVSCPEADDVVVPVSVGNRASWRSLERVGFCRYAEGHLEPDNPVDPPDHYVYRLERAQSSLATSADGWDQSSA